MAAVGAVGQVGVSSPSLPRCTSRVAVSFHRAVPVCLVPTTPYWLSPVWSLWCLLVPLFYHGVLLRRKLIRPLSAAFTKKD